jgi:hypothetical protein
MRLLVLLNMLAATAAATADIVYLRDGSRYSGTLISQNQSEVVFRVLLPDGVSGGVRHFAAGQVARVERATLPEPATQPAHAPATTEPAAVDFEQVLREAGLLLDDHDYAAAVRALQKIVQEAPSATLAQCSALCATERGVALDVLLATARVQAAATTRAGQSFRLAFVTPYEAPALGRLLHAMQQEQLGRRHDGRTVADWAAARDEYSAVRPDSRQLAAEAARAVACIEARLHWDPQLKDERPERARLARVSEDLARLAAHVAALPGYTAPTHDDELDPAVLAMQKLAAEAAASQPADSQPTFPRTPPVAPPGQRTP